MAASSLRKASLSSHSIFLATVIFGFHGLAYAERPMNVDDASTLERGGAKLEFGWSRDGETSGWDGAAGLSPVDTLELEIGFGRSRDGNHSPASTLQGRGFAAKWIPLQRDRGLSAGLKYAFEREKGTEVARMHALNGLMTWAFAGSQLVHINLGREWADENGKRDGSNIWGLGVDLAVTPILRATAEVFGAEHSSPSRAIGLRYELFSGVNASGAIGRGKDGRIGNLGVAWEF